MDAIAFAKSSNSLVSAPRNAARPAITPIPTIVSNRRYSTNIVPFSSSWSDFKNRFIMRFHSASCRRFHCNNPAAMKTRENPSRFGYRHFCSQPNAARIDQARKRVRSVASFRMYRLAQSKRYWQHLAFARIPYPARSTGSAGVGLRQRRDSPR